MKIRVYPGQNLKEMRKTRSSGSDEVFGPELWFKKTNQNGPDTGQVGHKK